MNATHNRPAGYAFLSEQFSLEALPNWSTSSVSHTAVMKSTIQDGQVKTVLPPAYWPGDGAGDHLEFALKYEGTNLGILSALFDVIPADEIAAWVSSKPTGKYARKIWYLYEFLTGQKLPLPDLRKGNYIELLDRDRYFTAAPGRRMQRQRIIDNLLGGRNFCPVIRRTEKLAAVEKNDLQKRCEELMTSCPPDLLRRALNYLHNKETKSSFELEHIRPDTRRTEKFVALLEAAGHRDFCKKPLLLEAQNSIVDPRFRDTDYRTSQNYVGQTISYQREIIHYVSPKPDDLPALMDGLLTSHQMMKNGGVPAIIHAAAVSYGFVFMHPFEDGNGRIHRFLIHNILSQRGAVPEGIVFPVSAAMLKNPALYDRSLEAFSKPLLTLAEYVLDDAGQMTVLNNTGPLYRYIDMTAQAEALYDFISLAVEQELAEELDFLAKYDRTKRAVQEIADIPDRLIDLFIKFCLQNNGCLSAKKREAYFSFLTDDELSSMENAVREGYAEKQVSGDN